MPFKQFGKSFPTAICIYLTVLVAGCSNTEKESHLMFDEYAKEGEQSFDQQRYSDAISQFSNALRVTPPVKDKSKTSMIYAFRGMSYFIEHEYEKALADFDEALELLPFNVYALYGRGMARTTLHDVKGAIEDFDEAIRLDSDYAHAYVERGRQYLVLGKHQKAIEDFSLAIDVDNRIELMGVEQVDGFTPISYRKHEPFQLRAKALRNVGEDQKASWDEERVKALLDDENGS